MVKDFFNDNDINKINNNNNYHENEIKDRKKEKRDIVKLYLKEIKSKPLLTPKEEKEYAERVLKGDEEARQKMIESNLKLVVKVAKRYMNCGLMFSDLIEEGNIGLIKAVEKFSPSKNCRFSTYATLWIRQSIERALVNQTRTVRLPAHVSANLRKIVRGIRSLTNKLKREPTLEEIAEEVRIGVSEVRRLMEMVKKTYSIDDSISHEHGRLWLEKLEDKNVEKSFSIIDEAKRIKLVSSWLELLSPEEKKVIILRFGLEDNEPQTLEEIGKKFGVTRERIRQIEVKALEKLRRITKRKDIVFLEMI